MKFPMFGAFVPMLCLLALPASAGEADPTATEILDRALTALGGETRLAAHETLELEAEIEIQGLTGEYRYWARSPGSSRLDLDLKILRLSRGFDGTVGWEQRNDAVTSMVGTDLERMRRGSLFQPLLSFRTAGVPARVLGGEPVGERRAWVVEFRPETGGPERFYFDTETWLPLKEVRLDREGDEDNALTSTFSDYRPVEGVMLPFRTTRGRGGQKQTLTVAEYWVDRDQPEGLYARPGTVETDEPYQITLSTIPRRVFKENDGVWGAIATESWLFHLVVDEKYGRPATPIGAAVELFSGESAVKSVELSSELLEAVSDTSFTGLAAQKEIFDLRHHFSEPVSLAIDRLVYTLRLQTPEGDEIEDSIEIPLTHYVQKTKLNYPVRGRFVVAGGHAFNDDHKGEWSQHYADDILVLGDRYELLVGGGSGNEGHATWGAEILAPAAGTVVYARNDVPDNAHPGVIDLKAIQNLPDPLSAVGGNIVVIDHGNDEFSMLAHMIEGSVRVKSGDRVEQGQVLGLIGNSGNSDAPHLHYQLMAGATPFRSDGLPARFENVVLEVFAQEGEAIPMPSPKRGIPLVAR